MTVLIDIDQLRTFIAIAETGSFTKAADIVHKTQSAVSMQMKRLEERLDKPIFARDGRASKLTEDGERLLDYARRIVKLNLEALAAFAGPELTGSVRLGVPDDYADRYLPEIMARYSRAYPGVELTVICEPSVDLLERIDLNELDLAIITTSDSHTRPSETFRRERLLWVTSSRHGTHQELPLPLALGRQSCGWRRIALDVLENVNRPHRMLFTTRMPARSRPRCSRASPFRCCRNWDCARACGCSPPPTVSRNCRIAASASCAIRTRPRRWRTRSPSTSCLRSTTCRKRRRQRSKFTRQDFFGVRRTRRLPASTATRPMTAGKVQR